ncbi:spermidine synthase [Dendrothele bispora CBS 962.96]|uniref:Spermidine synthase n=1 Tax=Dendrothele bispora (strain CBS 962.96) TaxID=1314807 RepID=A0A4S8MJ74_DENBC|nr:spermidine synthase [Dendrothele bispora CBS 962.96]
MPVLTHPSVQDGWFREISSQWPGQAMTLKVNKILHVEKSLFQDVLVFESETYGNVLVLDGAIQCTERDEFSYQEMITHLPMASHPNPERVLVIGGGDGGVVREALKYDSVKEVVLCDIDEAVPRVSKIYLPHMADVLSNPKVTVHIGDGFAFLQSHTSTYDVIVTDSSDPVGPAMTLFQKPYYQLLHDALRPGGHIAAQGECLWLHLPLIADVRKAAKDVGFAQVEYAFTTIPTYPSGQIGFLLASKAGGEKNDLKVPVKGPSRATSYWNVDVHRAAYVLPEFGRSLLEEGKDIQPKFGSNATVAEASQKKKVLLLGSGYVARPCAEYIVRSSANELTIACRTLASAKELADSLPHTTAISLDVNKTADLEAQVAAHDLVISLIPYTYHAAVIKAAIKSKTNVVTTSYVSPAMRELDEQAKAAGIIVMNEIGLDPGIDHLYAVKTINEVHAKGGKVKQFLSYCGGLPAPQFASNPLGYKFSWSSRGVLLALLNNAAYLAGGKKVTVSGEKLMAEAKPYYISPAYAFVAYPNRDSTGFREWYKIDGEGEGETVVRGTLRYQGFPEFIKALVEVGWLNGDGQAWLAEKEWTWSGVLGKMLGAEGADESKLVEKIKSVCAFPSESEATRIISGFRWIGMFSSDKVITRAAAGAQYPNLLDTLCTRLEELMKYEAGERDYVMLQHRFVVEWKDGKVETLTSTLEAYGAPLGSGHSAMALTVGLPCGIATQMILDGELKMKGVQAPYSKEICEPIRLKLESEGVGMVEGKL